MPSDNVTDCERCGLSFDRGDAAGLCPRCLLRGTLGRGAEKFPRSFGRYSLLEEQGRGGMGLVYRAWDPAAERIVALKTLRSRELASETEVRRFLEEARRASSLRHDNIVRVLDVGEHEGTAYFTMDFVEGTCLADVVQELRARPRAIAALVQKLASAVHHAHQRLVLHRDLKPGNILLDGDEPRLVDFGIAQRLDVAGDTGTGNIVGTLEYMAPEQLEGSKELTSAVDIYGLGALLYELLCGRPPQESGSAVELLKTIRERAPRPPRAIDPLIDPDLERICLKCLEKSPTDRYASAAGVAADLGRFLDGEPVLARPLGARQLAKRWVQKNPIPIALVLTAALLLITTTAVAVSVAKRQEAELRADVLETNAFAAQALSGAVLFELRTIADALQQEAVQPALLAMLQDKGDEKLVAAWRHRAPPVPFDSMFALDNAGQGIARIPDEGPRVIGQAMGWRDYFVGAARLGHAGERGVYVSRGYASRQTATTRFSLSAPVFGADGAWLGVLEAAVETNEALGRVGSEDTRSGGRNVVLVAQRDREAEKDDLTDEWLVLMHDGVAHGSRHVMTSASLASLASQPVVASSPWAAPTSAPLQVGTHNDVVEGFEGTWLAGMAPVGGTPLAVIVQTRSDVAVGPNERLGQRLLVAMAVVLCAAVGAFGLLLLWNRHRRRSGR